MKKYKLKRWYPSLDSCWEVGDIALYYRNGVYWNSTRVVENGVSAKEVENNPDFWELIEEGKPKPLFVTEDGVNVFEGDKYYVVTEIDFVKYPLIAKDIEYSDEAIRFKHESNADEYIWRNKRVFSYEGIYNYLKTTPLFDIERMNIVEQWIRELAKERSNQ